MALADDNVYRESRWFVKWSEAFKAYEMPIDEEFGFEQVGEIKKFNEGRSSDPKSAPIRPRSATIIPKSALIRPKAAQIQ